MEKYASPISATTHQAFPHLSQLLLSLSLRYHVPLMNLLDIGEAYMPLVVSLVQMMEQMLELSRMLVPVLPSLLLLTPALLLVSCSFGYTGDIWPRIQKGSWPLASQKSSPIPGQQRYLDAFPVLLSNKSFIPDIHLGPHLGPGMFFSHIHIYLLESISKK